MNKKKIRIRYGISGKIISVSALKKLRKELRKEIRDYLNFETSQNFNIYDIKTKQGYANSLLNRSLVLFQ